VKYFYGFDELPLNENGFELQKNGKPYLSLYHDCELESFEYKHGKFILNLRKVYDSGHGPSFDSKHQLVITDAKIQLIDGDDSGNLEDVTDLTLLGINGNILNLSISIGEMTVEMTGKSMHLKANDGGSIKC
jgi:hypothetical protein